jgi:hypothetical protein
LDHATKSSLEKKVYQEGALAIFGVAAEYFKKNPSLCGKQHQRLTTASPSNISEKI